MQILSLNTELTKNRSHLVFRIDAVPEQKAVSHLEFGSLGVHFANGMLNVQLPSTWSIDPKALASIVAKINDAENKYKEKKAEETLIHQQMLKSIADSVGVRLDSEKV